MKQIKLGKKESEQEYSKEKIKEARAFIRDSIQEDFSGYLKSYVRIIDLDKYEVKEFRAETEFELNRILRWFKKELKTNSNLMIESYQE
jgi:hypothetical protein